MSFIGRVRGTLKGVKKVALPLASLRRDTCNRAETGRRVGAGLVARLVARYGGKLHLVRRKRGAVQSLAQHLWHAESPSVEGVAVTQLCSS